ncbi:MAG TPA: AAA family ATPase [Solirubrobacterales bacterium]|nr:AAA family ATPase [Solirubrobacterales bacterium]
MGFLSRKKPKPAPVEIQEEQPIVDELQEMEAAVPERGVGDTSRDDGGWAAGPISDSGLPLAGESSESSPPAAAAVEDEPSEVVDEAPLNAEESEETEEGDGRMKAIDLIAPTRLDFLAEKEAAAEVPVKAAEVIAFANQKGGVAKTTTTLNLAVAFAESGYRVLCIDLDPQGNLTMSQGIDPDKVEKSLYDVLVNDMPISEIIVKREIDIAVASIDLAGAEIAMSTKIGRERSLEKALKEVAGDYDFVCIDTPPSLGLLTINALTAANKVIVPVQCEYLSMRGLVQLQNTLKMIQENLNPDVRIEGILPTMLDSRTIHAKEAVEILEENFGDLVFQSRIKKAIKFAEAPVKGASVLKYDSTSSAANYYRDLAKEVLSHGSA